MEKAEKSHAYFILRGYGLPFTRRGAAAFLAVFILGMIPVLQIFMYPIAFLTDEAWWRRINKVIVMAFKMLAARLLLFAPALALYLLIFVFGDLKQWGPGWLYYIPLTLMVFFAVSAVIRLPMAMAALAKGCTVKEALDGRFVKLLVSASFGRYIASLVMLFPFVALTLLTGYINFFIAWAYSGLITAWTLSYLGCVTNRCYDTAADKLRFQVPLPERTRGFSMPRAAKSALSLILALIVAGQAGALAFNEDEELASGNYPAHSYTADEYNQAFERFTRSGQLNQYTQMMYNSDTGNFYCVSKKTGYVDVAAVVANFVGDSLPVISTIKNVYEWNKYRNIANDPTRSQKERAAARVLMWIKGAGATLSLAGPLGKLASGVTGKTAGHFLIIKSGQFISDTRPIIEGLDDAIWAWDRVGDASELGADIYDEYTPERALGLKTKAPEPQQTAPASGKSTPAPGTAASPSEEPAAPTQKDAHEPFWGTYTGELVCPTNGINAYGMKSTFANPELTIQVSEGGVMSVNYTFDASYKYEAYGASMEGTSTMPVNWTNLHLTQTETGYSGQFTTNDFLFNTTTSYSGEAYKEGAGSFKQSVYVTVQMDIEFTMTVSGGVTQTRAAGKIYHTNTTEGATGADTSMVMTFDIIKS